MSLLGTFGRVYQGKLLTTIDDEEETATEKDVLIKTVSGKFVGRKQICMKICMTSQGHGQPLQGEAYT